MSKYVRLWFVLLTATGLTMSLAGCGGGPEQAQEGEGTKMLDPAAIEAAAAVPDDKP